MTAFAQLVVIDSGCSFAGLAVSFATVLDAPYDVLGASSLRVGLLFEHAVLGSKARILVLGQSQA